MKLGGVGNKEWIWKELRGGMGKYSQTILYEILEELIKILYCLKVGMIHSFKFTII